MKHHPYAVFFDILWDVASPRGIDAEREVDTRERRGTVRRWLRPRRGVEPPPVAPPPSVSTSTPAVPTGEASEGSTPDSVVTADGQLGPPGTPLAAG